MKNFKLHLGFTLIELMIVVAIVGVLAAIAYPGYMRSIQKTNRVEAKSELADAAQRLQRCYSAFGVFNHASCTAFAQVTTKYMTKGRGFYEISWVATAPANAAVQFTLLATAKVAPQLTDTDNGCDKLTMNQNGVRAPAACW